MEVKKIGKLKRSYYSILNEGNVIYYRKFWKIMKPMLSNNLFNSEKTAVIENKMLTDDKEIVEVLSFFINVTETFNAPQTFGQ